MVIGTPLEPNNLRIRLIPLIEKAGLPRIKIHAMRHTAATLLKDVGVPIKDAQLILGHASFATTLNVYQHGTSEGHRLALSAIGEQLNSISKSAMSAELAKNDSNLDSNGL